MMQRRQFLMSGAAAFLLPSVLRADEHHIDTAYINGQIWTGVKGAPLASALGVSGNKVAAIGAAQVSAVTGKKTNTIDLKGAFVTPGFIDPHIHLLLAADTLVSVNLRQAKTPQEFTRLIAEHVKTMASGTWIEGGNWDEQLWGGELPAREWVDAVTPNTPIAVARLDQHMLLVNSLGLKLAGIDRHTPDPEGGVIVRDRNGDPTGILKDQAKMLVQRVIPAPTDKQIEDKVRVCIKHALKLGVTQIHTKALDWISHDALRRIRAKGETGVRFNSFVPLQDLEKLQRLIAEEGQGDDWVRWGGLKGLADGSLGSGTALFHDPYTDAPDNKGISYVPLEDLRQQILAADRSGLQIAVHAIGDRANDEVLDMFAESISLNGVRDRRFIIEHAQHIRPDSIARFAELGVTASMQPYHAIDDGRWAEKRIGKGRLDGTYAFGSLLEAGARVGFGSDWPVAPLDPLLGLQAAVLRQTIDGANPGGWLPTEKVSVEAGLQAYTVTNAYTGFQDDRLGKLVPGYLADFAVFDRNFLTSAPADIHKARVIKTVVNGLQRFDA